MQFIVRGMTLATRSGSALVRDPTFLEIGQGELVLGSLEIPVPVILMLTTMFLCYLVLRFTQFGKYIYAIGDKPRLVAGRVSMSAGCESRFIP